MSDWSMIEETTEAVVDTTPLVRTAGVDLAARPAGTACCIVAWWPEGFTIDELRPGHVDDDAIFELIGRPDIALVGIDVPLGWPDAYANAVCGHRHGAWPFTGVDRDEVATRVRYRRTDRALMDHVAGTRPLSPSLDQLAACTVRAAHLLAASDARGHAIDRCGLAGPVAEVYPAASARAWGLDEVLRRARAGEPARSRLRRVGPALADRLAAVGLLGLDALCDTDALSLHAIDALLAALTARAVLGEATHPPAPADQDAAGREGWLHWPTCDLDRLCTLPIAARRSL